MRANRTTRIGIALLLVGLLLWGLYAIFQSLRFSPTTNVANNSVPATNTVQPVSLSRNQVAYLTADFPERTIITPGMFVMRDRKEGASPSIFVTDPESEALNFVTRGPLKKGNPLRKSDLVGHISEVGIAGTVQRPDQRALVIPITGKPAFHPMVRIGDRVDVVAAFEGQESRSIVEDVRVLAVDVLLRNYPATSGAMRGPYQAPPKGERRPAPVVDTNGNPVPAGTPGAPGTPGAAPAPTQPPAPPPPATAAVTLEVTARQANAITLAQNANAAIEFLIRPSTFTAPPLNPDGTQPTIGVGPVTAVEVTAVTRNQLSPYADRQKRAGAARPAGTGGGGTTRIATGDRGRGDMSRPPLRDWVVPPPALPTINTTTTNVGPMPVPRPNTYEIPIYADGKLLRKDAVRDPNRPANEPAFMPAPN